MRRFFSRRQRLALFIIAGGKCSLCGRKTPFSKIHADHINPFAKGGQTTLKNGQSLCGACNMAKGKSLMTSLKLRPWQERALSHLRQLVGKGISRALIAACPGSGKTRLAVAHLAAMLAEGEVNLGVVVVPTTHLKVQWQKELERQGIPTQPNASNDGLLVELASGADKWEIKALVVTYAQVAANHTIFEAISAKFRVLAILDEVHHALDEKVFGTAGRKSFDDAVFVLSLTGTPFHTSGQAIAFLDFEESVDDRGNISRRTVTLPELTFRYGDALVAEEKNGLPACRVVNFGTFKAESTVDYASLLTGEISTRSISVERDGDPLTPLVRAGGPMARHMLTEGLTKLADIRKRSSDGWEAMLVTACDGDHARRLGGEVDRIMRAQFAQLFGDGPSEIVTHDDKRSAGIIAGFGGRRAAVLIAVGMVSEGVDIPRLRVGVSLTNKITRLFFTQWVGRFIRYNPALDKGQTAWCLIPAHPRLLGYAREIEQMVFDMRQRTEEPGEEGDDGERDKPVVVGSSDTAARHVDIARGETIAIDKATEAAAVLSALGVTGQMSIELAVELIAKGGLKAPPTPPTPEPTSSWAEEQADLRERNTKLVVSIVKLASPHDPNDSGWFSRINVEANKHAGITGVTDTTPIEALKRRLAYLTKRRAQMLERS